METVRIEGAIADLLDNVGARIERQRLKVRTYSEIRRARIADGRDTDGLAVRVADALDLQYQLMQWRDNAAASLQKLLAKGGAA